MYLDEMEEVKEEPIISNFRRKSGENGGTATKGTNEKQEKRTERHSDVQKRHMGEKSRVRMAGVSFERGKQDKR